MRLVSTVVEALAAMAASAFMFAAQAQMLPADGDPCGIFDAEESFEANPRLLVCAERGMPDAVGLLAMIYWSASVSSRGAEGFGLPHDMDVAQLQAEGRRLMEAAASAGSAAAQNELGIAALDGEYGLDVDFALARHWLEQASEGGDHLAPFNLARLYNLGLGVEQSNAETQRYLRLSVARGHRPAMCSLAVILLREGAAGPDAGEVVRLRQAAQDIGGPCLDDDLMPELRR